MASILYADFFTFEIRKLPEGLGELLYCILVYKVI